MERDAYLELSGEKVAGVQVDCREFPGAFKLEGDLQRLSTEWFIQPAYPSAVCETRNAAFLFKGIFKHKL